MAGLLEGVRVLESAQLFNGDYLGQILADEGADVIKIESPFRGDYLRDFLGQMKPHTRGHGPQHMILNRNKRSVTIDLRKDEGKEIFWRLLAGADVFVDGNSTGALDKLGIGYEDQQARKPDIVFAAISGLGNKGPYGNVPTHGQSMSALAANYPQELGPDGAVRPAEDATLKLDGGGAWIVGPLYAAVGVGSALFRRERTGKGCYIDVGASDAAIAAAWMDVVNKLNRERIGADETGGNSGPKYGFYETKDGKFVLTALIEHHFWEHFATAVGRPDLLEEGVGYKSKNVAVDWGPESLRPVLRDLFKERTLAEWMQIAAEHDTVIAPANSALDVVDDAHLSFREATVEYVHPTGGPVRVTGNPIKVEGEHYTVRHHAPALGEHTFEVLGELYDDAQLKAWKESGVI